MVGLRPTSRKDPVLVRAAQWAARLAFALLLFLALLLGFGTSSADLGRLQAFVDSVDNWQRNSEFRQVTTQYVTRSSDALRTHPYRILAADWIVWIRSQSFVKKEFAINPTSRVHYANFSKGPLSAYLHLCTEIDLLSEDGTGGYLGEFEGKFGKSAGGPTAADASAWLAGMKWDFPVVSDAGAAQSVRSAVADARPDKPFTVRVRHIDDALRPHIAAVAADLGAPADPAAMTADQQYAVFDRLDARVRQDDPELWRTKQVSDFVGGIWGQVFSKPYLVLLSPYLMLADAGRWSAVVLLVALVWWRGRRRRPLTDAAAATSARPVEPARSATASPARDGLNAQPT
ncbi:MAG: hypothetical protein JWO31_2305 [Phycisphaerales bacterium]|nr:hypothetical protein [Phycisphaerales bacterium]